MKYWKSIAILVMIGVVGLIAWNISATTNCCEETDKEYEAYDSLVKRASDGDLNAIRELYKASKDAHRQDAVHMWALNGAIAGDENMASEYFSIYKTLPADVRRADEAILYKNISKKGARHVASMIGLSLQP